MKFRNIHPTYDDDIAVSIISVGNIAGMSLDLVTDLCNLGKEERRKEAVRANR